MIQPDHRVNGIVHLGKPQASPDVVPWAIQFGFQGTYQKLRMYGVSKVSSSSSPLACRRAAAKFRWRAQDAKPAPDP